MIYFQPFPNHWAPNHQPREAEIHMFLGGVPRVPCLDCFWGFSKSEHAVAFLQPTHLGADFEGFQSPASGNSRGGWRVKVSKERGVASSDFGKTHEPRV